MRYTISRYIGRSAALAICLVPALVFAQQQTAAASAAAPAADVAAPVPAPVAVRAGATAAEPIAVAGDRGDEPKAVVIVTGVTRTTTKKNATFSINTLSSEDIQRLP